jgi:hypothetical protein
MLDMCAKLTILAFSRVTCWTLSFSFARIFHFLFLMFNLSQQELWHGAFFCKRKAGNVCVIRHDPPYVHCYLNIKRMSHKS